MYVCFENTGAHRYQIPTSELFFFALINPVIRSSIVGRLALQAGTTRIQFD